MQNKNLSEIVTSDDEFWAQYSAWLAARVPGYGWNTSAYHTKTK